MSPTPISQDRKQWRRKAINNRVMAITLSNEFGGDPADYLIRANQVLRQKIVAANLNTIKEIQNGIPERLENLAPVCDRDNHNRESDFSLGGDFAFA